MGLLEHIKHEKCPHCGAEVKEKMQGSQHCSGEFNEWITFKCGCKIHYSPNFLRENIDSGCPNTKEIIEKVRLREEAMKKIVVYIKKLKNVDETYINVVLNALNSYETRAHRNI